ncbi:unnamed protein product [Sphagnum jensenii]|uniref:Uncharacterized protein n=1 Tax=Sphagnum jensenii TaxID=128206 RepID=A0ABP0XKH4_9BRYO
MPMNLFVQLWTSRAGEPSIVAVSEAGPEAVDAARVMAENQLQMRRHQEIGLFFAQANGTAATLQSARGRGAPLLEYTELITLACMLE